MSNEDVKDIKNKNLTNFSILDEWKSFGSLFLRPLTSIPVVISILALYYANATAIDKTASLILQIVSSVLLAIAGGSFYDAFKSLKGNNLLEKKGNSAVRNLSLSRLKIKNISYRAKEGASTEEIRNSLSLLEKDIANATQEWNDILPGVDTIEEIYTILAEKENELDVAEKDKNLLNEKITKGNELGIKEKETLKGELKEKEKEILKLSQVIDKLRLTTTYPVSGMGLGIGLSSYNIHSHEQRLLGGFAPLTRKIICSKCGKQYISKSILDSSNECDSCKSKSKE